MIWNTRSASLQPVQTYTYSYDKLNRLTKGIYKNAATTSPQNKLNYFNEEFAYDNMGNIDTLRRKNGTDASWYNNFKYTYAGNQLTKITDIGTAKRGKAFNYDVNGNANKLDSLKISSIEYNYLNLPRKFVKGTDSLVYRYDGFGQKLTKTFGSSITQYIDGIQYKNGAIEFIQTEEGRILPNGSSYIYEYFLQDHLGNTRAIVDHNGAIKQIQDYYPFGMDMNQGNALSSTYNLYKYNGKEKQLELSLDQLDYGARFYDAEIGRWNVVDPLASEAYDWSPYRYGYNNPMKFIDPTGMLEDDYTVDDFGKINLVRKTDDNFDRLIKVDDNGNETNTSITLDKGILKETPATVLDGTSKTFDDYTIMQTSDNKQAVKLFEFLGKNTKVEWGKISMTGGSIISTSHEARRDRSSGTILLSLMTQGAFMNSKNFLIRNGVILDQVHSHPNSEQLGASGNYGNGGSENGDKKFAERVEAINPNLPLKIYHIKTGGVYFQYNSRQNLIR